jgi:outer membrane immunogenic protein
MSKLAVLFGGAAIASMAVVSASAADLPSRKEPAYFVEPVPVFTWTGFYVGLNAGAAIRANTSSNYSPYYAGFGYPSYGYGGYGSSSNNIAFVGGGQVGYNWQTGPVVFGLETDFDYRSGFGSGGFLGTARGRLGYAFSNAWLLYATGGLAYGNTFNDNSYLFNSGNSMRVGWTVGGGLEYAVNRNWSIRTEYLYVDLGKSNLSAYGLAPPRSQSHLVRLGVNYRFNSDGPAAVVAHY